MFEEEFLGLFTKCDICQAITTQDVFWYHLEACCYDFKLLSDNRLYSCSVLGKLSIVYSRYTRF